jgi:hypothetical protein
MVQGCRNAAYHNVAFVWMCVCTFMNVPLHLKTEAGSSRVKPSLLRDYSSSHKIVRAR